MNWLEINAHVAAARTHRRLLAAERTGSRLIAAWRMAYEVRLSHWVDMYREPLRQSFKEVSCAPSRSKE